MTALGPESEAALKAAMERLFTGRPECTDGALTIANLAREAGVSRATANRAGDLLATFRAAEAGQQRSSPKDLKERIRALEAELRAARRAETAELRALVRTLAQHVQVLTLQVAERDAVIADLRAQLACPQEARIVPLHGRPRDAAG
jgi:polyhydroxyalkanoate synthesis regulator phasin